MEALHAVSLSSVPYIKVCQGKAARYKWRWILNSCRHSHVKMTKTSDYRGHLRWTLTLCFVVLLSVLCFPFVVLNFFSYSCLHLVPLPDLLNLVSSFLAVDGNAFVCSTILLYVPLSPVSPSIAGRALSSLAFLVSHFSPPPTYADKLQEKFFLESRGVEHFSLAFCHARRLWHMKDSVISSYISFPLSYS